MISRIRWNSHRTFLLPWVLVVAAAFLPSAARGEQGRAAGWLASGPFEVKISRELEVRCDGETILAGEQVVAGEDWADPNPDAPPLLDPPAEGELLRTGDTLTLLVVDADRYFRREVHVAGDRVEITFEIRCYGELPGDTLNYRLLVPPEALGGAAIQSWHGRPDATPRRMSKTVRLAEFDEPGYLIRGLRFAQVGGAGVGYTIDFTPEGPSTNFHDSALIYRGYLGYTGTQPAWIFTRWPARYGHNLYGKIILRPGAVGYAEVHPIGRTHYKDDLETALAVDFSRTGGDETFTAVAADAPGPDAAVRFAGGAEQVEYGSGGFLWRDAAATADANRPARLELDLPDGLYLLSLRVYEPERPLGPFEIRTGGRTLWACEHLPAGQRKTRLLAVRSVGGKATVELSGDWRLNAVSAHPLLFAQEDYRLARPYWHMEVEDPEAEKYRK